MLVIREVFTAKPGQASKLAALMKSVNAVYPAMKARVLTDYAADFNTVVLEAEVADMAEFERHLHEYHTNTALRDALKGYTDLWITGRREIYRVA